MVGRVATVLAAAAIATPVAARAQSVSGLRAGVARPESVSPDSIAPTAPVPGSSPLRGVSDVRARRLSPIASAVAPGSGQFMLGNDRFVVYAAAEVIGWWRFSKSSHEQSQQEAAFKAIARNVARSHFSSSPPDGDWTYYESMRDFLESGNYSLSNSGTVVPETDTSTFNGHLWLEAQATNATLAGALAEYESRAIKPNFQWSWRNAQLQYDQFKRTTALRNDAHYAAIEDLIAIAANHVLSMVDAFATFRLQVRPLAGGGASVGASAVW